MNKSPKEMSPDPFLQVHRKNPEVFMKILNFLELKRSFIRGDKEVGQLCADGEYS